ncbi:MAG: RagB/SusD family nutrient uptake outer membrane protein [Bacteroidales bacterium]|jgi:hypothetical protein|nr:RagB/SusD family nutrient uptake outer membrane protein [Bacteroidales bacterium]MCI1784737.1 RagB/SusD family nutrient uptake outer membrane protein [Bacteroidales bacterium]
MKKLYILIAIAVTAISSSSCEKWLEATSSTQISAEKLFSTRSGFHEALSGVYIDMGSENCYGKDYTWFVNDLACYPYVIQSDATYSIWQSHLYEGPSATLTIKYMWKGGYNVIANVNKILQELDEHRDIITDDTEYNLMKGELLAIRAYLHFDIMRMFGLDNWNGDNADKLTVPYVTKYDKEPTKQKSYSETAAMLLDDINTSLECLKEDPVTGNEPSTFENEMNTDGFWSNRTKHLNYYAVEALAARVYLWEKDYSKAKKMARNVIDSTLINGTVSWVDAQAQVNKTNNDYRDWTFSQEQIFSLEVTGLYSIVSDNLFTSTSTIKVASNIVSDLFPVIDSTGAVSGAEDIRGPAMALKYTSNGYIPYKLYGSSSYAIAYRNRMPMIRISEMYYILAEAACHDKDYPAFVDAINEVRSHRGITDKYTVSRFTNIKDCQRELTNEYEREFINEGQLFYFIKRTYGDYGMPENITVNATPDNLIYPYPESETTYGHIQEK